MRFLQEGIRMDAKNHQRAKEIFAEALELPLDERRAFLETACASDKELLAYIESLLQQPIDTAAVIGSGAIEMVRVLLEEADSQVQGRRIGQYRIVREVGRGGMGVVYEAVRDDDQFQQRVAMKLVQRGVDSESVVARFRQERQILAGLDHPNIARLLDGGITDDGRLYFVMEFIDGLPIDVYCTRHRLDVRARLTLFQDVCSAVQYSHQRLIVHRDLKPANILVTAAGQVKLLDFGVAKLLDQHDVTAPLTRGIAAMTPAYASPEQVRGDPATTASDVYSLGVVLYELLAGRRPYDIKSHSVAEMERIIFEQEPGPPSRRVAAETAVARGGPKGLRKSLAGELDHIVLMAMRKEPARRYASAEHLGDDLRRYLEGRPVRARPDTLAYRMNKFVRRHRTSVAIAALVMISLIGGVVSTKRQANIAEGLRQVSLARQLAAQAERVLDSGNPVRGMLLAIESYRRLRSEETDHALRRALRLLPPSRHWRAQDARVVWQGFLSGGKLLATADADGRLRVVEAADPSRAVSDTLLGAPIVRAAADRDGRVLLIAHADGAVSMRALPGGAAVWHQTHAGLTSITVRNDAAQAAIASNRVSLVDGATGRDLATDKLDAPVGGRALAFSPDGRWLAAGLHSGQIWLLNTSTSRVVRRLRPPALPAGLEAIDLLAFSPDSKWLAVAPADGTARIFNVADGAYAGAIKHDALVTAIDFSADNKWFLSASLDETARLWRLPRFEAVATLPHEGPVTRVSFAAGGRRILTGSLDGIVRVWNIEPLSETARISHDARLTSAQFATEGNSVVTTDMSGETQIATVSAREEEAVIPLGGVAFDTRFSPDGRWLATVGIGGTAVWDVQMKQETFREAQPPHCLSLAFSDDNQLFATGCGNLRGGPGTVIVRRTSTWQTVAELALPAPPLLLRFATPNRLLLAALGVVTGRGPGGVLGWSLADWKERWRFHFEDACYGVSADPKGRWVAAGCGPVGGGGRGAVAVLSAQTGQELHRFEQPDTVITVQFSQNGEYLVAGAGPVTDGKGRALIWQTGSWRLLAELPHRETVLAVALHPRGNLLATGSGSAYGSGAGQVQLWTMPDGRMAGLLDLERTTSSVAISADGRSIAAASHDRTVRIWELATRRLQARMNHADSAHAVTFHPSGAFVASASLDGTARIWRLLPDDLIAEGCRRAPRNMKREEWSLYLDTEPWRKTCPHLP
jgi:serine/threonine protein kinase/WD40 repeat protein